MNYEITEENECGTVASRTVKSVTQAKREIKAWKRQTPDNLIFVSWYRVADGQHGYLNPSGDHAITGEAW